MSIYDDFGTDETLERDGVWVPIGEMEFKLRYAGGANKAFQKAFDKEAKPYRRGRSGDFAIPERKAAEIFYKLYAHHIVVDWKGVIGKDGEELPFSIQNCIQIFTDLPKFFLTIKGHADEIAYFQTESLEEEAGNS